MITFLIYKKQLRLWFMELQTELQVRTVSLELVLTYTLVSCRAFVDHDVLNMVRKFCHPLQILLGAHDEGRSEMKNALDVRQILGLQSGLRHEGLEVVSGRDLKEKEAP